MKIFLIDLFYHACNLEFVIWNLVFNSDSVKKNPDQSGLVSRVHFGFSIARRSQFVV